MSGWSYGKADSTGNDPGRMFRVADNGLRAHYDNSNAIPPPFGPDEWVWPTAAPMAIGTQWMEMAVKAYPVRQAKFDTSSFFQWWGLRVDPSNWESTTFGYWISIDLDPPADAYPSFPTLNWREYPTTCRCNADLLIWTPTDEYAEPGGISLTGINQGDVIRFAAEESVDGVTLRFYKNGTEQTSGVFPYFIEKTNPLYISTGGVPVLFSQGDILFNQYWYDSYPPAELEAVPESAKTGWDNFSCRVEPPFV